MDLSVIFAVFLATISNANGQGVGALRLVRNNYYSTIQAYTSGIVEIYYSSTWGNICDDTYFGSTEANVICHQLAFTGASSYGNSGSTSLYGTDTNSMLLEDVDCSSSNYLVLLQCSYSSRYSSYCNDHDRDAFVVCYTTKIWSSNLYSGQLRIVNGTYSNQGRLEVYCNGQWGTVCDDSFGATDANVACRQLGYSDYSRYEYTSIYDGSSSQPIWLDNVRCTSSSTSCLANCESCPSSQYHNCGHSEDVSLECEFSYSRTSGPYATLDTCRYADPSSVSVGAIVGGVIASIVFICILIITIPLCICCCLGVGVGAAFRNNNRRPINTVVTGTPTTTVTTAVTDTKIDYPASGQNPPPPYTQPPNAYPASGYPPQEFVAYPPQQPNPYPPGAYPTPQYGAYPPQQFGAY